MENIKSYYDSLEFNSNLLDMMFKFYPDGIVCKDSELKYYYINDSYCRLFSPCDNVNIIHNNNNRFLSDKNLKLVNSADKEIRENLYSLSYVLNTENNKILSVTTSPVIKDSAFKGLISCVKDITQEETIKEKFVNSHFKHINTEKQLQQQREAFVASVGHDLKNPTIAQIRGLELLLKGEFGELSNEQRELLTMILDSCRYMNGMLSSLLDTYRNYDGVIKLNFSEFSMLELVNECVSEMLYVARDKELKIAITSSNNYVITADQVQIKRVIMNLLTNAIKYAYKNTDLILRIFEESAYICFEFENNSPYIAEEKQKTLFKKYVSYSGIHNGLGTGLGLYASKKIIESHNGKIYLKSYKDDRNIFGFKIPEKQECSIIKEILL